MSILRRFRVPLALFVLSVAFSIGAIVFIVKIFSAPAQSFRSGEPLTLHAPARAVYTVWHDYETVDRGTLTRHDAKLPDGLHFQIKAADGRALEVKPADGATMTVNGRKSVSVVAFEVPDAGDYVIAVENDPGSHAFSVSESTFIKWFIPALMAGMAAVIAFFAAGITLLVALTRRE